MKKIVMLLLVMSMIPFYSSFSRCLQISVQVMGGWTDIEVSQNGTVTITCGQCMDQVCFQKNEDGSYIIGTKCNAFFWYLNCPEDSTNPSQGFGLINAIFEGFVVPGNPNSGLIIGRDGNTLEIHDFNEWCRQVNSGNAPLTFEVGSEGGGN